MKLKNASNKLLEKERNKVKKTKYYYISYLLKKGDKSDVGGTVMRTEGIFRMTKVKEELMKIFEADGVVIINFIKITKKEYDNSIEE